MAEEWLFAKSMSARTGEDVEPEALEAWVRAHADLMHERLEGDSTFVAATVLAGETEGSWVLRVRLKNNTGMSKLLSVCEERTHGPFFFFLDVVRCCCCS